MSNQPKIPDPETRRRSVRKLREVCAMFDEQIMVLDELIAQVENDIRDSPINFCRREREQK